jgi:NAD(P)-dependent dehydrogenase (short-subunit alcohol dehydrogenase family)
MEISCLNKFCQKSIAQKSTWALDESATYVVSGGLGGIGQIILEWLARKGAKNIIVPSRSGASSMSALNIILHLRKQGIRVECPSCDVSSSDDVASMLDAYANDMPPIKGCINASMVLQVRKATHPSHFSCSQGLRMPFSKT